MMHQVSDSDFAAFGGVMDRRKDDAVLLHIRELQGAVKTLDIKITHHHEAFRSEVTSSLDALSERGFPQGDLDGHRKHHEIVMAREEERMLFWKEMRIAGAKWLGLGVLGFIATAVWVAIKSEVHK